MRKLIIKQQKAKTFFIVYESINDMRPKRIGTIRFTKVVENRWWADLIHDADRHFSMQSNTNPPSEDEARRLWKTWEIGNAYKGQ